MCRRTLGLCQPQLQQQPVGNKRRAQDEECSASKVAASMSDLVSAQRDTVRLARQVAFGDGTFLDPRALKVAISVFQ